MGIAIANRKNRCDFGALRASLFTLAPFCEVLLAATLDPFNLALCQ